MPVVRGRIDATGSLKLDGASAGQPLNECRDCAEGSDVSTPSPTRISRRQMLKGVGSGGALAVLVTLTELPRRAFAGIESLDVPAAAEPERIPWVLVPRAPAAGWSLQPAVSLGGTNQSRIADFLPLCPSGGPTIFSFRAVRSDEGYAVSVDAWSALDGSLDRSYQGRPIRPPLSNPLHLVHCGLSSDNRHLAVLHLFASQQVERHALKTTIRGGPPSQVAVGPWQTWRAVELFDLARGASIAFTELPTSSEALFTGDLLFAGDSIAVYGLDRGHQCTLARLDASSLTLVESAKNGTPGHILPPFGVVNRRPMFAVGPGHVARLGYGSTIDFLDLQALTLTKTVSYFGSEERIPAKPFPTVALPFGRENVALVNAAMGQVAVVDLRAMAVTAQQEIRTGRPKGMRSPLAGQGAAVSHDGRHLYVADASGVRGGIWVLGLPNLDVEDRWLSTTSFDGLWVGPTGVVWAAPSEASVLLSFNEAGSVQAAVEVQTSVPPCGIY
jgi:hypothetical protein